MRKYASGLLCIIIFCTSCGQNQADVPSDTVKPETKNAVTSHWPDNASAIAIRKGKKGTILIAALSGGVFRYEGRSFTNLTRRLAGSHKFNDVLEDRHGNLWITSLDSGVYYYDARLNDEVGQGKAIRHFTTRDGFAHNQAMCVYEGKDGMIWFGTGSGLSCFDGKSFRNFTLEGGQANNIITTIMEDKAGRLWIGTRLDVFLHDGKTFANLTNRGGKAIDIWSILEDKNGTIWLGGYDGLWRYDGKTFTNLSHNRTYVSTVLEDKDGNIWTSGKTNASPWALSRYDQKSLYNNNPTVIEIVSERLPTLSGMLEADDGSIWFGTGNGLYRYDGKTIHRL